MQACKAIGYECERYDDTLGDFFAHKYAVHAGVEYISSQKNPVDSPRDVELPMRVSLPKLNFWRQPEVVPAWMDEKQPSDFVATHIGWRSLLRNGIESCHKTHEERVDFILKEGRDTVKFMAALQKYLPQGVYLYVSPFQVGASRPVHRALRDDDPRQDLVLRSTGEENKRRRVGPCLWMNHAVLKAEGRDRTTERADERAAVRGLSMRTLMRLSDRSGWKLWRKFASQG